jgi:hypothetical protein
MNFEGAFASMLLGKRVKRKSIDYDDWIACNELMDVFYSYIVIDGETFECLHSLSPSDLLAKDWEVI